MYGSHMEPVSGDSAIESRHMRSVGVAEAVRGAPTVRALSLQSLTEPGMRTGASAGSIQ